MIAAFDGGTIELDLIGVEAYMDFDTSMSTAEQGEKQKLNCLRQIVAKWPGMN